MKNLQINLEESLVAFLDRIADEQHKSRTAVIREAVSNWVKVQAVRNFEEEWIAALNREPVTCTQNEDDLWIAAEVWGDK